MNSVLKILVFCVFVINSSKAKDLNPYQNCTDAPPGTCGPNADCIDKNSISFISFYRYGGAYCKCRSDAFGKPPNCELYCKEECKKGEYCDFGEKTCKPGCKYSSECDDGEYCHWEDKKCTKGCDFDDRCKSDEYCDSDSHSCLKGCRTDEDCGPEDHCAFETHACTKGCRNDEVCQTNEFCNNEGQCEKGCRGDASCKTGEYCDWKTKSCVEGCFSHVNCQMDEYCNSTDTTCWKGCWENDGCKSDEFCDTDENECKTGCRNDESCNSDQYCDKESRECTIGCRLVAGSCSENEVCDSRTRKCKEGCSKCKDDEYCDLLQGDCHKICTDDLCGPNSICSVVSKNAYCSCADGFVPEKNVGCVKKSENDDNGGNCTNACADNASCDIRDKKVHCYCPWATEDFRNPIVNCPSILIQAQIKPFDLSEISLQAVVMQTMGLKTSDDSAIKTADEVKN